MTRYFEKKRPGIWTVCDYRDGDIVFEPNVRYAEESVRKYVPDESIFLREFRHVGDDPPEPPDWQTLTREQLGEYVQSLREWMLSEIGKKQSSLALPLLKCAINAAACLGMAKLIETPRDETQALVAVNCLMDWIGSKKAPSRTGRPTKGESGKDSVVIMALAIHHQYETGGIVGNYTPAGVRELSDANKGLTTAAISRFFAKQFGDRGHKGYVAACRKDAATGIGFLLAKWQYDLPSHFADLRADE